MKDDNDLGIDDENKWFNAHNDANTNSMMMMMMMPVMMRTKDNRNDHAYVHGDDFEVADNTVCLQIQLHVSY
jgi:hypothetical protein